MRYNKNDFLELKSKMIKRGIYFNERDFDLVINFVSSAAKSGSLDNYGYNAIVKDRYEEYKSLLIL